MNPRDHLGIVAGMALFTDQIWPSWNTYDHGSVKTMVDAASDLIYNDPYFRNSPWIFINLALMRSEFKQRFKLAINVSLSIPLQHFCQRGDYAGFVSSQRLSENINHISG
jgi:hypothetical protein